MNTINRSRQILFNLPLKQIEASRHLIPYCFRYQDGKAIALNRDYLPLGMRYEGVKPLINYSDYTNNGIDPACVPELDAEHYQVYMFSDDCPPWESSVNAHAMLDALNVIANNYALIITAGDKFDD